MTRHDYETDAKEKLAKCGGSISIRLSNTKDAPWVSEPEGLRPHYRFTLKGPGGSYTSDFWGSINDGKTGRIATAYDILTFLQWYDVGSHEDFCADFGYEDDHKSRAIRKALCQQYKAICRVFPNELARACLAEIV